MENRKPTATCARRRCFEPRRRGRQDRCPASLILITAFACVGFSIPCARAQTTPTFTVDEVLEWFRKNGIQYVNSIPRVTLREPEDAGLRLFQLRHPGRRFEHLLCQLGWIFTKGREGGFFITIGRKA